MIKHAIRILLCLGAAGFLFACNKPDPNHLSWKERRAASLAAQQAKEKGVPAVAKAPEPVKKSPQELFAERCQVCHRLKGRGGEAGPDLTGISRRANSDYVASVVCDPDTHFPGTGMPSFAGQFTDQELHDLAEYVCGVK
ncbi:c-type cytochrome [Geomesophilobacter sediminis]|uniref:Cytochrome c n=1 Tax=Geomesophilobacter sediminis TaxID=2798584 RepID=A0A8J7M2Q2_9BACT|nr:cytochrome c [Geomesophilobacter sediminis]MBJ6727658.1 cytochrome c [Geomesophilobacter sediminis]